MTFGSDRLSAMESLEYPGGDPSRMLTRFSRDDKAASMVLEDGGSPASIQAKVQSRIDPDPYHIKKNLESGSAVLSYHKRHYRGTKEVGEPEVVEETYPIQPAPISWTHDNGKLQSIGLKTSFVMRSNQEKVSLGNPEPVIVAYESLGVDPSQTKVESKIEGDVPGTRTYFAEKFRNASGETVSLFTEKYSEWVANPVPAAPPPQAAPAAQASSSGGGGSHKSHWTIRRPFK